MMVVSIVGDPRYMNGAEWVDGGSSTDSWEKMTVSSKLQQWVDESSSHDTTKMDIIVGIL